MAIIKIADLKSNVGKEVKVMALLQSVSKTVNRYENQWYDLCVSDMTGSTTFKMWAEEMTEDVLRMEGQIVEAVGKVDLFQNRAGLQVVSVKAAKEGTYNMSDFVPSIAEEQRVSLRERMQALISEIKDSSLLALLKTIFTDARIKQMSGKASSTDHHRFAGGLLLHTVEVAEAALAAARDANGQSISPYHKKIDEDLVIAGALLHDVGEITLITDMPNIRRTERGQLMSVASESLLFANMYNNKLQAKERVQSMTALNHILLTAHAGEEFPPRTAEALVVRDANLASIHRDAYSLALFDDKRRGKNNVLSTARALGYSVYGGGKYGE